MAMSIRKTVYLYQKQSGLCAYCGDDLDDKNVTLDHVLARAWDGEPSRTRNMVLCCLVCQKVKSSIEQKVDDDMGLLAMACIFLGMLEGNMKDEVRKAIDGLRAREGSEAAFDPEFLSPAELQSKWEDEENDD